MTLLHRTGFLVLQLLAVCFFSSAYAEGSASGLIHHGKEKIDALHDNGKVTLEGTQVVGVAEVNGSLSTQDATLGSLNVNGHAYLHNTKVIGKANITGFFNAEKSSFDSELCVKAHKITLKNCQVNSIYLKKVIWPFDTQVVELLDGSVCKGDITFESGKGHVILKGGSSLKGKVVDGDLEKG